MRLNRQPPAPPADQPTGDTSTIPCRLCGLAIPAPPPQPKDAIVQRGWPSCDTCSAIVVRAGLAGLLADCLGTPVDGRDRGVAAFLDSDEVAWTAWQDDRFVQPDDRHPADAARDPRPEMGKPGAGLRVRWGAVDKVSVGDALDRAVRKARTPRRHRLGACGVCGVTKSLEWWPYQAPRLDTPAKGDRWPLCARCGEAFHRSGASVHDESWRSHVAALALDLPRPLMAVDFIQMYAETVASRTDAPGCRHPFGFIAADRLGLARRMVWSMYPHLAPEDFRARQDRLRRATALVHPPTPVRSPDGVLLDLDDIDF